MGTRNQDRSEAIGDSPHCTASSHLATRNPLPLGRTVHGYVRHMRDQSTDDRVASRRSKILTRVSFRLRDFDTARFGFILLEAWSSLVPSGRIAIIHVYAGVRPAERPSGGKRHSRGDASQRSRSQKNRLSLLLFRCLRSIGSQVGYGLDWRDVHSVPARQPWRFGS